MKNETKELTPEEMTVLAKLIIAPTFKYMMKRVNNHILTNKEHSSMDINSFVILMLAILSSLDVTTLNWIEIFFKSKTGKNIESEKLRMSLFRFINDQLGVKVN